MATVIRTANPEDIHAILALDSVSSVEPERQSEIHSWVQSGNAVVACHGSSIIGYAVLEDTFFRQSFVAMLQVAPPQRRQGIATALLRHLECACRTTKLFTSTNASNLPMQALLSATGYEPSGVIYHLDEGDPELIYYKALRSI